LREEGVMAHVVTERDTSASPERVLRALTDFSPKRLELWPNIDRRYFEVKEAGATSAEVKEGSGSFGGVWEESHYDWSRPGTVRIEVKESNAFEPGSYWVYDVTQRPDGGSHVRMEFDRRPRNLRGKIVSALLDVAGTKVFGKSLEETLRRVESSQA
jgi:Polyketide cyclase / dehydrase and lipid transport